MAKQFDQDVVGAILEFVSLFPATGANRQAREDWDRANLKPVGSWSPSPSWLGPASSKAAVLAALEGGRDRLHVRGQVDRVFLKLEMEQLLEPWAKDDNPATAYRVISALGAELLREDSYIEYIFGLREVVARWRTSVVKIYHSTDSGIGTGYLVAPNLVATARHVLEGLGEFVVSFEDGVVVGHKEVLLPESSELDIALIRLVDAVDRRPFPLALTPALLEEVVVFGFPPVPQADDAYLVVNRGEVSANVKLYRSDLDVLVVSTLLRGGNSGGPVVNRRGQVVGTVSENLFKQLGDREKSINEGLGFAAAVPSLWMQDLIAANV